MNSQLLTFVTDAAGIDGNGHTPNAADDAAIPDTGHASRRRWLYAAPSELDVAGDELISNRFLCRGGGMLLCGPTGVGKSSFSMQLMMAWALGRPCFGLEPVRPIKSLLIQAENDWRDLNEMRDGVAAGLELSQAECQTVGEMVSVNDEDALTGKAFLDSLDALLATDPPDIVWIDPALAFLGGDSNSQRDVGAFLREGLNQISRRHNCAVVVVHHSNKPPSGQQKPNWTGGDFAYLGAGSAEWANWPRAILALRSLGSRSVFELVAAKRGQRLRWYDEAGKPAFSKLIAHAKEPGVIFWRDAEPDDLPAKGRPKATQGDKLLAILSDEGMTTSTWQRKAESELKISRSTFKRRLGEMESGGSIVKAVGGKWLHAAEAPRVQKVQKGSK